MWIQKHFFVFMPRSETAGSYGIYTFNHLRTFVLFFIVVCLVYIPTNIAWVHFYSHIHWCLLFFIFVILHGERCDAALMNISLLNNGIGWFSNFCWLFVLNLLRSICSNDLAIFSCINCFCIILGNIIYFVSHAFRKIIAFINIVKCSSRVYFQKLRIWRLLSILSFLWNKSKW